MVFIVVLLMYRGERTKKRHRFAKLQLLKSPNSKVAVLAIMAAHNKDVRDEVFATLKRQGSNNVEVEVVGFSRVSDAEIHPYVILKPFRYHRVEFQAIHITAFRAS